MTEATSHEQAAARAAEWSPSDDHITTQLGCWVTYDDRGAIAHTVLHSSMWGQGSSRPRLSVFASIADALGGQTPEPSRFPTIDLRAHLVAEPPSTGPIEFVGRPLRIGRRSVVTDITMHDESGQVFGRATVTLVNNLSAGHSPWEPYEPVSRVESLDRLIGPRTVDERTLELDLTLQITNGGMNTPFGGAQAWFSELAVEHLAGQPMAFTDLDIRFLAPLRVGPLRAVAVGVGPTDTPSTTQTYRVDLVDVGNGDALVSAITIVGKPYGPTRATRADP